MRSRTAILISSLLGLVVLVPVLAVVGLGAYGSTLSEGAIARAESGAELQLIPAHGPPGSKIKIEGRKWPPVSAVDLYLSRALESTAGSEMNLRLAHIYSSRSGTFAVETLIPAAVVGGRTADLLVTAVGSDREDSTELRSSVRFAIDPFPTNLLVAVSDAASGAALAGARVRVHDTFGRPIAEAVSGEDGTVVFKGVSPGQAELRLRMPGYYAGAVRVTIPESTPSEVGIGLESAPPLRLYAAGAFLGDDGRIRLLGVDRWSGEPFMQEIEAPAGRLLPLLDDAGSTYFGYLQPEDGPDSATSLGAAVPGFIWSLGRIQRLEEEARVGYPRSMWLARLGATPHGDLFYSITNSTDVRGVSALYLIEPATGKIVYRRNRSSSRLPVLSRDGSKLYLVPRVRGATTVLDVASGNIEDTGSWLNLELVHVSPHPERADVGYALTWDGDLYEVELSTGVRGEPFYSSPGATWVASLPGGLLALANPARSAIVVVDPSGAQPEYVIGLPSPADWVWADPEGPFLYAGEYRSDVLIVHLLDRATLRYEQTLEFPNRQRAGLPPQVRVRSFDETRPAASGGRF